MSILDDISMPPSWFWFMAVFMSGLISSRLFDQALSIGVGTVTAVVLLVVLWVAGHELGLILGKGLAN